MFYLYKVKLILKFTTMTKTEFTRLFKTTFLLFINLDIPNKDIDDEFVAISHLFDNGDLKNAKNRLNVLTDKLIDALES